MKVQTRTIIYLTYLIIAILLSEALPFFKILGVTPFIFFSALFVQYFGFAKIILIYTLDYIFFTITNFQWLHEFSITLYNIPFDLFTSPSSPTSPSPFFINPISLLITVIFMLLFQNIIMIWLTHRALVKVGIYNRFQF